MHKRIVSTISFISAFTFITGSLSATPAWSVPVDKKPEIQKPADKGAKELGELKDDSKGNKSVKKKAVKKAGTAAAAGVAGAKVKSGVKEKGTKDKE